MLIKIIFLFICSSFNFIALFIYVIMNIWNMKLTGFRSQCIILSRCNILRHWRREKANLRIKAILNPWKLFFLINSYKFILKRKKYTHNYTVNYKAAHLCKTEKASINSSSYCLWTINRTLLRAAFSFEIIWLKEVPSFLTINQFHVLSSQTNLIYNAQKFWIIFPI